MKRTLPFYRRVLFCLLKLGITTVNVKVCTAYIGSIVRAKPQRAMSDFFGLSKSSKGCNSFCPFSRIFSMVAAEFKKHGSFNCSGAYTVYTDAAVSAFNCSNSGKTTYTTFCRNIVTMLTNFLSIIKEVHISNYL